MTETVRANFMYLIFFRKEVNISKEGTTAVEICSPLEAKRVFHQNRVFNLKVDSAFF